MVKIIPKQKHQAKVLQIPKEHPIKNPNLRHKNPHLRLIFRGSEHTGTSIYDSQVLNVWEVLLLCDVSAGSAAHPRSSSEKKSFATSILDSYSEHHLISDFSTSTCPEHRTPYSGISTMPPKAPCRRLYCCWQSHQKSCETDVCRLTGNRYFRQEILDMAGPACSRVAHPNCNPYLARRRSCTRPQFCRNNPSPSMSSARCSL